MNSTIVPNTSTWTRDAEMTLINQFLNGPTDGPMGYPFVNLTAMARALQCHPRLGSVMRELKERFEYLVNEKGLVQEGFVKTKDRNACTWAHPRVAIECASCLSPSFRRWFDRTWVTLEDYGSSDYPEVLRLLAMEVRRSAQLLEECQRRDDPDWVPGVSRCRRVRTLAVGE